MLNELGNETDLPSSSRANSEPVQTTRQAVLLSEDLQQTGGQQAAGLYEMAKPLLGLIGECKFLV